MNSLERATLTVIGLAMIAASTAQATICCIVGGGPFIQSAYESGYTVGPGSANLSGMAATVINLPNGVSGLDLAGSGSLLATDPGSFSVHVSAVASSNGKPSVESSYPVSYAFDVEPGGGTVTGWTLDFHLFQAGIDHSYDVTYEGQDVVNTGFGGVGAITGIDPSLPVGTFEIDMTLYWTATAAGQTLGFDLPADIDHAPEPASFLLVGTGIGLLALVRRRRKA